jgi:hypothetical protein
MNSLINVSASQLRRAASIKERIETLGHELDRILGSANQLTIGASGERRKISAKGIANIRRAQQARWAGRGSSKPRKGWKMDPAARARLSAIAKARWRAAKAAGRAAL